MLMTVWDVLQRMLNKIKNSVLHERENYCVVNYLGGERSTRTRFLLLFAAFVFINPHSICLLKTKISLVRAMARQKSLLPLVMVAAIPTNFGYTKKKVQTKVYYTKVQTKYKFSPCD